MESVIELLLVDENEKYVSESDYPYISTHHQHTPQLQQQPSSRLSIGSLMILLLSTLLCIRETLCLFCTASTIIEGGGACMGGKDYESRRNEDELKSEIRSYYDSVLAVRKMMIHMILFTYVYNGFI